MALSPGNETTSGLLSEMEHVMCQLERGTVVTKFFQRKQPDRRILSVKRETRQVVWHKPIPRRNVYEGAGNQQVFLAKFNNDIFLKYAFPSTLS